ncbi:MAG: hypothetical protein ACLFSQ_06665 [Candidatus Zixiibacteriota bacterium]
MDVKIYLDQNEEKNLEDDLQKSNTEEFLLDNHDLLYDSDSNQDLLYTERVNTKLNLRSIGFKIDDFLKSDIITITEFSKILKKLEEFVPADENQDSPSIISEELEIYAKVKPMAVSKLREIEKIANLFVEKYGENRLKLHLAE